jgi:protein-disulfide isomerase
MYNDGMSKSFWAIIAIIVVVFGGILLIKQDKAGAPSNGAQATNHIQGEGKTGVTLVEYGDYQCPFCGSYYPILKSVQEKYNDQIYFQFRNLPLSQQHKNAFAAARAAEAAGLQNKFWEMHDLIYANQNVWTPMDKPEGTFEQYATQLGLNLGQFKSDASQPTKKPASG